MSYKASLGISLYSGSSQDFLQQEIFRANCQTNYVPQEIPATPISLFKASEMSWVSQSGAQMARFSQHLKQEMSWGWYQYALGSVEVYTVPGDHHTMMNQPNVQVLAEKLRVELQGLFIKKKRLKEFACHLLNTC